MGRGTHREVVAFSFSILELSEAVCTLLSFVPGGLLYFWWEAARKTTWQQEESLGHDTRRQVGCREEHGRCEPRAIVLEPTLPVTPGPAAHGQQQGSGGK